MEQVTIEALKALLRDHLRHSAEGRFETRAKAGGKMGISISPSGIEVFIYYLPEGSSTRTSVEIWDAQGQGLDAAIAVFIRRMMSDNPTIVY